MRRIDKIIVHCSAGRITDKASAVAEYHLRPVAKGGRGWTTPGYHYFVEKDGSVVNMVPEDKVSNGVAGHNANAINVCYAGGVNQKDLKTPEDTRTEEQKVALRVLLRSLKRHYPTALIYGHRDFAPKACPSFDARKEYKDI